MSSVVARPWNVHGECDYLRLEDNIPTYVGILRAEQFATKKAAVEAMRVALTKAAFFQPTNRPIELHAARWEEHHVPAPFRPRIYPSWRNAA